MGIGTINAGGGAGVVSPYEGGHGSGGYVYILNSALGGTVSVLGGGGGADSGVYTHIP